MAKMLQMLNSAYENENLTYEAFFPARLASRFFQQLIQKYAPNRCPKEFKIKMK